MKYIHNNYDAVFIQSTTVAGFAVKAIRKNMKNVRITLNIQDIFPYNAVYAGSIKREGIIFKTFSKEQRYAYKKSDHIITISEDMKDLLVKDGVEENKISVIYNWSYQDDAYMKESLDFSVVSDIYKKDYFNVTYAGNIGVMTNVDLIIDTAILLKEDKTVWFHIIGNGVYKDKLIKKAEENGLNNISFWPMQPAEYAPCIYAFASLNVIPLMKDVYRTALPSKTATCLLCGQPIVFAIGKNSKFGKKIEEYHYLIDSNNPVQLKNLIVQLKGHNNSNKKRFINTEFTKTKNSKLYADIICDVGGAIK